MHAHTHTCQGTHVEVRGQFAGSGTLLPPCHHVELGLSGLGQQPPLSTEPSLCHHHHPFFFEIEFCFVLFFKCIPAWPGAHNPSATAFLVHLKNVVTSFILSAGDRISHKLGTCCTSKLLKILVVCMAHVVFPLDSGAPERLSRVT